MKEIIKTGSLGASIEEDSPEKKAPRERRNSNSEEKSPWQIAFLHFTGSKIDWSKPIFVLKWHSVQSSSNFLDHSNFW